MRLRSVLFAALGAGLLVSASAPAFAEWHGHGGWHRGGWHHRGWYGPYAYGPRVYYAPPPPPPPYYAYHPFYPRPGVTFGVTIP